MTEHENLPSSTDLDCAAGKRCGRKSCFVWAVLLFALAAGAGYTAFLRFPKQGLLVPVTQASPKLVALEQRLDVLETQIDKAAPPAGNTQAPANEEVKKPKAQIESKEIQDQQTAQKFIASAFAFWDLREAAKTGLPFAAPLAALRAASLNSPATTELLLKLEPYALEGAPTLAQLRESLSALEKTAPLPAEENAASSFWARVKTALKPFVSVRPLHDARFAELEKALETGNAAAALGAVKALPGDAQVHLAAWQAKLEARIAVDNAFQALSARFMTPPSTRSGP